MDSGSFLDEICAGGLWLSIRLLVLFLAVGMLTGVAAMLRFLIEVMKFVWALLWA